MDNIVAVHHGHGTHGPNGSRHAQWNGQKLDIIGSATVRHERTAGRRPF